MGTVSDLVTEIQGAGGFDTTPADALIVLDRRHKLMCARARWHRLTKTLTATTATDALYSTLDAPDLVEAFSIDATSNGYVGSYSRTEAAYRGQILDGTLTVIGGRGGVFIESAETDETDTIPDTTLLLYPAVDASTSVTLTGAFLPPTLTTAETAGSFVRVPVDYHEGLLAGVYASMLMRPGESRPDLAATLEAVFSGACGELRDRADRRHRTRGPRQIATPNVCL